MKRIVNTKVIETEIMFNGDTYKVWEYTNDNKEQEIAIMNPDGYDVSLIKEVLDGQIIEQIMVLSADPEQYIHEKFCSFKKEKP